MNNEKLNISKNDKPVKVSTVLSILNKWLIPQVKWKDDPIGLLVGDRDNTVKNILIALNITPEVLKEAIDKSCDLIVSHHPLFKRAMNKIVKGEYYSDIVLDLIKNDISLISCHTNFDLVKNGVSKLLADRLNLIDQVPMVPLSKINGIELTENYKVVVYSPIDSVKILKDIIHENDGATIGSYDFCFFESKGIGTFRGDENTNPTIGTPGEVEKVEEIKLETIVPSWKLTDVLNGIRRVHPYEEPAIDYFKIENESDKFGLGIVGMLNFDKDLKLIDFVEFAKKRLGSNNLRVAINDQNKSIKKVAVCGGSGASFWKNAHNHNVDLYLTSEFDHHSFLEAKEYINIIDATHHTTEKFVTEGFYKYLEKYLNKDMLKISEKDIDPVSNI